MQNLGMKTAFTGTADFTQMSSDPRGWHVDAILHKAVIEVNEKGSEAAAVTAIQMFYTSAVHIPQQKFEFRADRSFVFQIFDADNNVVLFTSIVDEFDPLNNFQP